MIVGYIHFESLDMKKAFVLICYIYVLYIFYLHIYYISIYLQPIDVIQNIGSSSPYLFLIKLAVIKQCKNQYLPIVGFDICENCVKFVKCLLQFVIIVVINDYEQLTPPLLRTFRKEIQFQPREITFSYSYVNITNSKHPSIIIKYNGYQLS